MFIYFNENKLAYHKGQLAPFFIVLIIILLIAALVTVNIGKVSLIKTYTSNAADAGALAGGSVMATVFNTQAVMNSEMIIAYERFYALMAVTVAIIIASSWAAVGPCAGNCCPCWGGCCGCCPSRGCRSSTAHAISGLEAAIVALIAFQVRQFYYYRIMKERAIEGRENAIKAAYRYAFLNSGISSKLKSCRLEDASLCDSCEEACERDCKKECGDDNTCLNTCSREELDCLVNNCQSQRAEFQLWLKDIGSGPTAEYTWLDGQGRNHKVHVGIDNEDVGTYKLKLSALPTVALVAFLVFSRARAVTANVACNFCPCGTPAVLAAAASITGWTLVTLAGLIPTWEFDASGFVMIMWPISWIIDINHNRLVGLTTWQEHEGEDFGSMGEVKYPHIESYSLVNFEGSGKIYDPDPYFDATIIQTDVGN